MCTWRAGLFFWLDGGDRGGIVRRGWELATPLSVGRWTTLRFPAPSGQRPAFWKTTMPETTTLSPTHKALVYMAYRWQEHPFDDTDGVLRQVPSELVTLPLQEAYPRLELGLDQLETRGLMCSSLLPWREYPKLDRSWYLPNGTLLWVRESHQANYDNYGTDGSYVVEEPDLEPDGSGDYPPPTGIVFGITKSTGSLFTENDGVAGGHSFEHSPYLNCPKCGMVRRDAVRRDGSCAFCRTSLRDAEHGCRGCELTLRGVEAGAYLMYSEQFNPFPVPAVEDADPQAVRITREEANERAIPFLEENWKISQRDLAEELGCSPALVGNLPAWRAVQEERKQGATPKRVTLTRKLEGAIGDEGPTPLETLTKEQNDDAEPSPLDDDPSGRKTYRVRTRQRP